MTPGDCGDDSEWLPTPRDVRFYRENGYYISPAFLPHELLDEARAGLDRHHAGERDFLLPSEEGFGNWKPSDGGGIQNNEFLSLQNRQIRRLALHPSIGKVAARLSGATEIRLFDDQAVTKLPESAAHGTAVGWHADHDYWHSCSSPRMLTAWIPFHDCPEEMGPLVVIPGSHKWPRDSRKARLSFHSQNMDVVRTAWPDRAGSIREVPICLRKGQVSFHHARTLHGSHPNRSRSPRVALAVHLQDHRNRYRRVTRPDGTAHPPLFNDKICRRRADGTPDYQDDAVFPLLWRSETAATKAADV